VGNGDHEVFIQLARYLLLGHESPIGAASFNLTSLHAGIENDKAKRRAADEETRSGQSHSSGRRTRCPDCDPDKEETTSCALNPKDAMV
jgi:hypothetical protein